MERSSQTSQLGITGSSLDLTAGHAGGTVARRSGLFTGAILWLLVGVLLGVGVVVLFRQGLPEFGSAPIVDTAPAANQDQKPQSVATTLLEEVEWRFYDWIVLWVDREADSYLALFDPSFPDWEAYSRNRRQRMESAAYIELTVEDVELIQTGPEEVVVRFVQIYKSDSHRSRTTKELVWRQTSSGPKIFLERLVK